MSSSATLLYIVLACLAGGTVSIVCAAAITYVAAQSWIPRMVSFAVGALLATAFLDVLPEALERGNVQAVLGVTLGGVLLFFMLEKVAIWRHSHGHTDALEEEAHGHSHHHHGHDHGQHPGDAQRAGMLVLIGDGFHNFVDGILIAAAFLADFSLGIATTLAIVAHEIPQEMGGFVVLLNAGYSKARAFCYNLLSTFTSIVGAVLGYYALGHAAFATPYVLALAGASFIYISLADLVPEMHRRWSGREAAWQLGLIGAGILLIYGATQILHTH